MLMKTSELLGVALNWAVAKCEGLDFEIFSNPRQIGLADKDVWGNRRVLDPWYEGNAWEPSTDWTQGGLIIEREGISIRAIRKEGHKLDRQYLAAYEHGNTGTLVRWSKQEHYPNPYYQGSTPLIAAMRCYVANKLGYETELPKELDNVYPQSKAKQL